MALDTTYSDLLLMIGGQLLFLFILVVITVFGTSPLTQRLPALPFPFPSTTTTTASASTK